MIYRLKLWFDKHWPGHALYTHREMDELRENAVSEERQRRVQIELALADAFPEHFGGGELVNRASIQLVGRDFENMRNKVLH